MPRSTEQPIAGPGAIGTLVILGMGLVISLFVWHTLRTTRAEDEQRRTQAYAEAVAGSLERELDALYRGLRSRWEFWGLLLERDPQLWHQAVSAYLHRDPAILALTHGVPALGRSEIEGSVDGQRALRELIAEVREAESDSPSPEPDRVIGPLHLPDGRELFAVQLRAPTATPADELSILAAIDPTLLIENALGHQAEVRALTIHVGGSEIYRRDASQPWDDVDARTIEAKPTLGAPWAVRVSGTRPPGVANDTPLLALIAGAAISGLIALIVHVGTLSRRRASALALANVELTGQILEARRGERELKELSDQLEARVQERTGELNETIVELETFNYSVSHDLRGPLGAISNFAAILAADYAKVLDDTGREYLRRIGQSAGATASMMDALIAYSRSGSQTLTLTRVDTKRLVQEVWAEYTASHPGAACEIQIGELPEVDADENMLRVIWSNLISNACKFVRDGEPPRVEIGSQVQGSDVVYFLRDQGIGFDMRYAAQLYKVFERLHPAAGYAGHGVGLAIVARLVRRHGGRLWAQSAVGKGATFYFTLRPGAEAGDESA